MPAEPAVQRLEVDLEDEDRVEQLDEPRGVAGAAAEEGDRLVPFGDHRAHPVHVPEVVLVAAVLGRLPGLGITLVGQLGVTVDGVHPSPAQLAAHRGLAGARDALDEVVPDAHPWTLASRRAQLSTRGSVFSRTSSSVTPGASSTRRRPSGVTSSTQRSVMIRWTTPRPV